jgi:putative heme-binding domain-containing protein
LSFELGICSAAPRPLWTSNRIVGSPNPPAPFSIERVRPQLTFSNPVDLAFMPDSQRLFVMEQGGRILSFNFHESAARPDLAIDLRRHHQPFDSAYSLAFHPGFATNRYVFINYNEPGGRKDGSFISRFTVSTNDPPIIDPASEKVILRWLSGGHNGCTVAFGNDGFLYISTGDAANPDPPDMPYRTGQDISDLLSSILRIDADHDDGTNHYRIPRDNPFVNTAGARPEVWAFGFRNPWRMSFDKPTGDLWVGDVGWEQWEMVYRVERGGNYGWAITEGPNLYVRTDVKQGPGPILPPVFAVPHSDGASITGGYVYHGTKLPRLSGAYVYGDWETGKFWALRHDAGKLVSNVELCDTALKPVSFALDPEVELLILDYNGGLYRLVPNSAPPANQSFPRKLSETGLFTSLNPLTPAPGTVPYRINAPMWNDHATAEWLLGVPGDGAIAPEGGVGNIAGPTWFFPSNTVLARTLTLEMETGKPDSRRCIETQILHWDGQAWNPYSYRWNSAQSDATLVAGEGTNDLFTVIDPHTPGGKRQTPWHFMSRAECLRCHNAWAGEALTLNWLQLGSPAGPDSRHGSDAFSANGRQSSDNAASTEATRLSDLGVLRVKKSHRDVQSLVNPYDATQPVADRARSWLHVNCSTCHRFGAGGTALIHVNVEKPIAEMRALNEKPLRGDFGISNARIISPGDPFASTLLWRVATEGAGHMPIIGPRLTDVAGLKLIQEWIRSLEKSKDANVETIVASSSSSTTDPAVREPMSESLADSKSALALACEIAAGSPALRDAAAALANQATNATVRDLFQQFLPPNQRRQTLGASFDPRTVLALNGDAARGKEVFLGVSQCSRCHLCGSEGRAFGPDLGGVSRRYAREQVLEQILNPSKIIAPEFRTTIVTLADGAELSGFVVKRTDSELALREETLIERRVKLSDIKESHESTMSAMPERLLAPLTAQEAADLLEFLLTSKAPASSLP